MSAFPATGEAGLHRLQLLFRTFEFHHPANADEHRAREARAVVLPTARVKIREARRVGGAWGRGGQEPRALRRPNEHGRRCYTLQGLATLVPDVRFTSPPRITNSPEPPAPL